MLEPTVVMFLLYQEMQFLIFSDPPEQLKSEIHLPISSIYR